MSNLFEDEKPGGNAPEFSVAELSGAIKKTLESNFGRVRVRGEIGRVVRAGSGHLYYDLKDDRAVLACTTWKGQVAGLSVLPEEGLEVIATGKLSAYGPQSKYNLNVDQVEVAGAGALMAMLEKRKQALAKEGLFDQARKKPIPYLPRRIGVVTSPSGAVIRDILHRLRDRFPREVLVWPVAVQGDKCAPAVTAAIDGFNTMPDDQRPDLLIVARGGGSIEDLWGFNEETVIRATARSTIPIISAVGHETDTTLIDFASDLRAPTPTAAAEHAVPVRSDLLATVTNLEARRVRALGAGLENRRQRLRDLSRALPKLSDLLRNPAQALDHLSQRLPAALTARLDRGKTALARAAGGLRPATLSRQMANGQQSLAQLSARMAPAMANRLTVQTQKLTALDRLRNSLGYRATLERGYAVIRDGDNTVIQTKAAAAKADELSIEFADGVLNGPKTAKPTPAKPKAPKSTPSEGGQGSLF